MNLAIWEVVSKGHSMRIFWWQTSRKPADCLFIRYSDAVRGFTPLIPVGCFAMNGESRPLVADKPVEFEDGPLEVQDFRKITHRNL